MAKFGETIVRLRKERHLSQEGLAQRSKLSKNTIQNIEAMDAPTIRGASYLALAMGLDLTTAQLDGEWKSHRIDQSIGDPVRRGLPIINKAPAGDIVDYQECSIIDSGQGAWYVHRDGIEDPHAFAVIITGDSMKPTLTSGTLAIFSPLDDEGKTKHKRVAIPEGSVVYVRFSPDSGKDGCTVARWFRDGKKIKLAKDNPKHKTKSYDPKEFISMAALIRYDPVPAMTKTFFAASQLETKGEKEKQVEGQVFPDYEGQSQ